MGLPSHPDTADPPEQHRTPTRHNWPIVVVIGVVLAHLAVILILYLAGVTH